MAPEKIKIFLAVSECSYGRIARRPMVVRGEGNSDSWLECWRICPLMFMALGQEYRLN